MNSAIQNYLDANPVFRWSIAQKYHQLTKMKKLANLPPSTEWPETWKKVYFKAYPRLPVFSLPKPELDGKYSLKESLYARHSSREFIQEPLSLEQISNLLFYSSGIREPNKTWTGNRFYPSAGARYPIEIYPVILNAKNIKPGVYHYYPKAHALEELFVGDSVKKEVFKLLDADWMKNAGMVMVMSAVFLRNQIKYGQRGYRHIMAETGHICQNIYLLSPAFGLGCCNSGGYVDDGWNRLLDLDGLEESVVSVIIIGQTK